MLNEIDFRHQIYYRKDVSWNEICLKSPRIDLAALKRTSCRIECFPMPGRIDAGSADDVVVTSEGLRFPDFGRWYVYGGFGVVKVVLIDPKSTELDRILAITTFVSECTWHSNVDAYYVDRYASTRKGFDLYRLLQKLYFSDQPLGLKCGHVTDVLAFILLSEGVTVRRICLRNDIGRGHIFLEAFLESEQRWVMLDADFGVVVYSGDRILSSEEILSVARERRVFEIVVSELTQKLFARSEKDFSAGFSGQYSWRPSDGDAERGPMSLEYIVDIVSKRYQELWTAELSLNHLEDDSSFLKREAAARLA